MKTFKWKTVIFMVTLLVIVCATCVTANAKTRKEVGTIIKSHKGKVTCVDDRTGNAWEFYGTGYHKGERCQITFKGKQVVDCVTDRQLVKAYCRKHFPKRKIKFVKENDRRLLRRKSKKYVYVEKIVSRSNKTSKGYYIAYNTNTPKGKRITSYCIWNPCNNIEDDILAVVDNGRIR